MINVSVPFEFEGLHKCPSRCQVEVFGHDDTFVVMATELKDNPGTSVTNAWPLLANRIASRFGLRNTTGIVWIEHYPANDRRGEIYDRVFLNQIAPGRYFLIHDAHPWKPLSPEEVRQFTRGIYP